MAIQRLSLRDQVREQLEDWLADGRIKSGAKLDADRLAKAMGVSRTPLREALSALAQDGLVEAIPHRGFRVPEPDPGTVRDLYPMIGSLEGLAVRMAGTAARELAPGLKEINQRLATPHLSARQRWDLDRRWHEHLAAGGSNRELAGMLARLHRRVRHYEGLWNRGAGEIESLRKEHENIANLLAEGEVEKAAEALLEHWVRGVRPVTLWLADRQKAAS